MIKNFYTVLAAVAFSWTGAGAQNDEKKKADYFSFGASYVGDVVANLAGGVKTGAAYLGMANITAC